MYLTTPESSDHHAARLCEAQILQSLSTSFWLREAIKSLAQRDPLDALNDAETLLQVQRQRLDDMVQQHNTTLPLLP